MWKYGLCRVHKGIISNDSVSPFRPILSAIGTCSYNLLDIQSLFTDIPLDETIDICTDMVFNKFKKLKVCSSAISNNYALGKVFFFPF